MMQLPQLKYLPRQLQNESFRFVRLGRRGTLYGHRPIEKDWVYNNNYAYNNVKTMLHIENGNNIGIIGGYGNLLILDFDKKEYQDIIAPKLPKTFTVSSGGKNLNHMFYIVDESFNKFPIKKLIYDPSKDVMVEQTCTDVICKGGYVLAPFSKHRSGGFYNVLNNVEISHITKAQLQTVFGDDFSPKKDTLPFLPNTSKSSNNVEEIKRNISLSSVLSHYGVTKVYGNERCACPAHTPSLGNLYNLSFHDNEGYFKCFDSDDGGTVIDLVMHLEKCSLAEAIGILEKW